MGLLLLKEITGQHSKTLFVYGWQILEKNQLMLEAEKKSFWSCYKIWMATQEGVKHKTARKTHEADGP